MVVMIRRIDPEKTHKVDFMNRGNPDESSFKTRIPTYFIDHVRSSAPRDVIGVEDFGCNDIVKSEPIVTAMKNVDYVVRVQIMN